MISLTNVHLSFGAQPILNGVNLNIRENECLAVVGPNGCGKSTLLRVIARFEAPDVGTVSHPSRITIGYLPQEADLDVPHSLKTELLSAFSEVRTALAEMAEMEHEMARADPDSPAYARLLRRYAEASHLVEHGEGYALDAKVQRVAAGLGFETKDMARPCREFSGGWQMRILLAKILLQKPDVLLLDEPTNHLDLESMLWLEEWIRTCRRTVVMVSHERAFMDRLVERVVCLENGTADVYRGDYSHYLKQSEIKREAHWKAYTQQKEEIEQMESFIRKFRYNAARAAQVQSRIKQLEKIERIVPPFHPTAIHFDFPPAPPSHRDALTLKNLGHAYGDKQVFSDADLTILRGDKIGLVGVNGAGKSTLLRLLAGREKPTEGECVWGGKANPAYFAQYDTSSLTSDQTLLQAIESCAPIGEGSRARDVLGAFLFTGDDVEKPLRALSGGERTRFRLAQMLFSPANVLLLDEPTNHLDITSRATVEEALQGYTGTVIVVSHDRVFMDKVTNRIIEIENGKVTTYPGKYGDYLEHKQRLIAQQASEPESSDAQTVAVSDAKEQRRLEREKQKIQSRKLRAIERKIEATESDIAKHEARLAELERIMSDRSIAGDYTKLAPLSEEHQQLTEQLHASYEQWEKHHYELEEMSKQGD
jgi:ATP-binding cassette subfamily F protein 3